MEEYRRIYIDKIPVRTEGLPIPVRGHDVIHHALVCGVQAADGVIHFLGLVQAWFAASIVRPYFELTVRIMWYSERPNGWHELLAYWAKEMLAAADRTVKDCDP